jgi:lipopolysaccharide/colanic/teichoic acid biosynthesis glycosyltransferase
MAKRLFDIAVALVGIAVTAPIMLAVAAAIRLTMGAPVLFRQQRPGLHGEPFTPYKFRTMSEARAPDGTPLPDATRLTRLGRLLRKWSLDELPQLFNVLKGDMSLVGPRPLLMEYLPLYSAEQARRHAVKPGITGWAQINGRNAVDWPERFRLDVWYVNHRSFWLDLKILALTAWRVLQREGISERGAATMTPFTGNAPSASNDR